MATRLMRGNHRVVAFDLNEEAIRVLKPKAPREFEISMS